MVKEAKKFIDLFYDNNIHFYTDNDGKVVEKLLSNSSVYNFESPDIVIVNEKTILLVEHFEIDASRHIKRKGNLDKVEKHIRKLRFDAYANKQNSKSVSLSMKVECNYSKEFYIKNLERLFDQHYSKIDKYISNVLNEPVTDKNKEIRKAFFIEDTNPLGSYCLVDGIPKSIVRFQPAIRCHFDQARHFPAILVRRFGIYLACLGEHGAVLKVTCNRVVAIHAGKRHFGVCLVLLSRFIHNNAW